MTERATTILHVDDDQANRYAVTRSLVKAGFEVTEAADGFTALQKATALPDLIILDVRLPDIDGYEVCRRIKTDPATKHIPVLHLSASLVTGAAKAEGLDGGADAYLIRPVEPVELIATVNALLRTKRAEAELRASEEQLRHTVELNPQVPWTADPAGTVLDFSGRWLSLTGLTREQAMGPGWMAASHPEDRPSMEQAWRLSLATGTAYDIEHRIRLADGQYRWMRSRAFPRRDPAGRILRWYGTTEDVHDRRRAEENLRQSLEAEQHARAQAEEAGRMKDEFLATLSHELRTPLNAILGWATILASDPGDAATLADGLETICRNARAQTRIIEDLLDMSRIVGGKIRLDPRPTDLSTVLANAVETAKPAADAKSVAVSLALDPLPGPIRADPDRLQQVFWNLLSNAVKFTPTHGKVRVTLKNVQRFARIDPHPASPTTADGITADVSAPASSTDSAQADASSNRRHGGLGLGLAIAKPTGRTARRVDHRRPKRRRLAQVLHVHHQPSDWSARIRLTSQHPHPSPRKPPPRRPRVQRRPARS